MAVTINQGTAIGEGAKNGATPSTLANVAADPNNTQSVMSATDLFEATGTVPDTAAGFCEYPDGGAPKRATSYVTGAKFEGGGRRRPWHGPDGADGAVLLPSRSTRRHEHDEREHAFWREATW